MPNWLQTQIQFPQLIDDITENTQQSITRTMSNPLQLDEDDRAIIQSCEFYMVATHYLRKKKRFRDAAIGTSRDSNLKHLAWKFCVRHLDKIFPDIRQRGVPDPDLVYKEVCTMYCELKVEIMGRSNADRASSPIFASEPIMPSEMRRSHSPSPSTTRSPSVALSSSSNKRSKRRSRGTKRLRSIKERPMSIGKTTPSTTDSEREVSSLGPELMIRGELPDMYPNQEESRPNKRLRSPQFSVDQSPVDNPAECQSHQDSLVCELLKQNEDLQMANRRFGYENNLLTDYRNFVHYTLRLCQDTWLEEGNSAKAARLVQPARECEKIVEAFRDVLSDIDFQYFSDYYRLHKCAPPSRYWLDSVRAHKGKDKVL